jgi:outer membrane protein TolC
MLSLILSLATLSTPTPLTYEKFEKEVMNYSLPLSRSIEQHNAMNLNAKAARTAFLPSIDAEGTYQHAMTSNDISFAGTDIPLKRASYNVGISVMQPVYSGGAISNTYEAAKITAQIAETAIEQTADEIVHMAQKAYWNAAAKTEMYNTACRYVSIIERFTATLQEKYDAGAISKTDLLQMQTRLAEARLHRSTAQQACMLALQQMNILRGQDPDTPVTIADSLSGSMPAPILTDAKSAANLRPDFVIAGLNIDLQERQVKLTAARYNPTLYIGVQNLWGTPAINTSGKPKLTSALTATLQMPLLRWGERSKSVAAQRAMLNDATLAYHELYDQISLEVSAATTTLNESRKQAEYARQTALLAQENLDINTFSYTEGRLTILDVLSAQLTWLQAHNNLTQTRYNQRMALADYMRVTGAN